MLVVNAGSDITAFGRDRSFGAPPTQLAGAIQTAGNITPRPVEPAQGARFVYDRDTKRSFVEFLDPESGRVLTRFPADQKIDIGSVLETGLAQAGTSGNLLDIRA